MSNTTVLNAAALAAIKTTYASFVVMDFDIGDEVVIREYSRTEPDQPFNHPRFPLDPQEIRPGDMARIIGRRQDERNCVFLLKFLDKVGQYSTAMIHPMWIDPVIPFRLRNPCSSCESRCPENDYLCPSCRTIRSFA